MSALESIKETVARLLTTSGRKSRRGHTANAVDTAGDLRQQGLWRGAEVVVRVVGTEALRQCRNPEAVGGHVERLFGVPLEIISGECLSDV